MVSWVPQKRAQANKWYWVCPPLAFLGEFAIVYFIVSVSLITSFIAAVIILILVVGAMLHSLYHILPVAIAISDTGIYLKYRRKEDMVSWESIQRILKQDLTAYGGGMYLRIYTKDRRKIRFGGDPESIEEIYKRYQSYKEI